MRGSNVIELIFECVICVEVKNLIIKPKILKHILSWFLIFIKNKQTLA